MLVEDDEPLERQLTCALERALPDVERVPITEAAPVSAMAHADDFPQFLGPPPCYCGRHAAAMNFGSTRPLHFKRTPEPAGESKDSETPKAGGIFVVHKHDATFVYLRCRLDIAYPVIEVARWIAEGLPQTADGRIDLDAAEATIGDQHRVVAFAHVSNVLGSIADVARVEIGSQEYQFSTRLNGKPSTAVAVQLSPGANALNASHAVIEAVKLAAGMSSILPMTRRMRLASTGGSFFVLHRWMLVPMGGGI